MLQGALEVRPGQNPDKPVVVDAKTKSLVKGSGRFPKANDPATTGKKAAVRRSFREALEASVSIDPEDTAGVVTFEALMTTFVEAVQGTATMAECRHEGCGERHSVENRPNPAMAFKLIEALAGRAPVTVNTNNRHAHLVKMLGEDEDVPFEVFGFTPDEEAARRQAMVDQGLIDPSWGSDGG